MGTFYSGIFLGRVLWADSVFPGMNTIASSDQFKPIIKISGELHIVGNTVLSQSDNLFA